MKDFLKFLYALVGSVTVMIVLPIILFILGLCFIAANLF